METCFQQNIAFSVVDGFDIPMEKVKVVKVPTGHEVVMATDGYPFLLPTLAESENALTRLLATDPLCISEYLATKGVMEGNVSFDDRAYIRLKLV